MDNLYLVDAFFLARKKIRSLPPFHGARWSAWLRYACKIYGLPLNEIALAILPLRSGQKAIQEGELLPLRFLLTGAALPHLARLPEYMFQASARGEFSPLSFEFICWRDAAANQKYAPKALPSSLLPLSLSLVREEIELLAAQESVTLDFITPLRLKRPPGMARAGQNISVYCPSDFFQGPHSLAWLCQKIRFPDQAMKIVGGLPHSSLPPLLASRLQWQDLRYNESRHIALGGLLGQIDIGGEALKVYAPYLVLGQYLGAGKNPLFGLGFWRLPACDPARKIPLELT